MGACLVERAPQASRQPCLAGSNGPLCESFKPGDSNQPTAVIAACHASFVPCEACLQLNTLRKVGDAMDDCFAAA